MALTSYPGVGPWLPIIPVQVSIAPAFGSAVIDATGEKLAYCGRFWHKARTSKAVRRVGFRFGSVTKAGGSGLTVSLQNVTLTTGGPMQPDGTQDETVAIANGDSGFASNVWYRTGTLSADRTLTPGDLISVVIEYDGSGRLGADSVALSAITSMISSPQRQASVSLFTASWAAQTLLPNVILECDDGTFGTLEGAFPCSALNTHTYASNTGGADEYALEFVPHVACKIDGLWALVAAGNVDYEVVLYEGTTALVTVSIDGNTAATSSARFLEVPIAETTLSTSSTYRVAVKPTTTTSLTAYSFDVSDAGHLDAHSGGSPLNYATRLNAGSWSATTTRRFFAGIRLSAIDNGAGGSGGGVYGSPRCRINMRHRPHFQRRTLIVPGGLVSTPAPFPVPRIRIATQPARTRIRTAMIPAPVVAIDRAVPIARTRQVRTVTTITRHRRVPVPAPAQIATAVIVTPQRRHVWMRRTPTRRLVIPLSSVVVNQNVIVTSPRIVR